MLLSARGGRVGQGARPSSQECARLHHAGPNTAYRMYPCCSSADPMRNITAGFCLGSAVDHLRNKSMTPKSLTDARDSIFQTRAHEGRIERCSHRATYSPGEGLPFDQHHCSRVGSHSGCQGSGLERRAMAVRFHHSRLGVRGSELNQGHAQAAVVQTRNTNEGAPAGWLCPFPFQLAVNRATSGPAGQG